MEAESVERIIALLEISIKDKKYEALLILTIDRNFCSGTIDNLEKALHRANLPVDARSIWLGKVTEYRKLLAS